MTSVPSAEQTNFGIRNKSLDKISSLGENTHMKETFEEAQQQHTLNREANRNRHRKNVKATNRLRNRIARVSRRRNK